jgi:hypothetical protein
MKPTVWFVLVVALAASIAVAASALRQPTAAELREQHARASQAEAEADKAWTDANTSRASASATIARKMVEEEIRMGAVTVLVIGLVGCILLLGFFTSTGVGNWIRIRLSSVYPNAQGIFPVLIRQVESRGQRFIIAHDPNRQLGPTTIYHIQPGEPPRSTHELPADSRPLLEVTTNAQRAATIAAIAPHVKGSQIAEVLPAPKMIGQPIDDLPEVKPASIEPSHVQRLLAEVGGDDEEG